VETVLRTSDVNPDGTQKLIYIPGPGVTVRYSPMLMQRRKDLWGEDSLEFVPERWLDPKRIQEMTMDPFKFIPFNAGPRICLGQVRTEKLSDSTT
jgi:cytochrome P450